MEFIKIPVLGVANAGKTSLIHTLKREFNALKELAPTKRIERSKLHVFNKDLIVWDFGGQIEYRKKYAKKADAYFSQCEEIFFVVDIQDQDSYAESISYFKDILES